MEYARDLGHVDLWEESLRRSLERRGKPRRSSVELHQLRPKRDLTLEDVIERSAHYSQLRRQAAAQRPAMPRPSLALTGLSALTVTAAATLPNLLRGHGSVAAVKHATAAADGVAAPATTQAARPHPHPLVHSHAVRHPAARPRHPRPLPVHHTQAPPPRAIIATTRQPVSTTTHTSGGVGLLPTPHKTVVNRKPTTKHATTSHHANHRSGGVAVKSTTSHPTTRTSSPPPVAAVGYLNPLARAHVTPERIDQGVDYSGSGTLTALGAGRVTYSATSGTGWPGAFLEYRLTSGAEAGRYVYYAEHVTPLVRVGQTVRAGQAVATMSGGIEVGWGSGLGTQPLAQAAGQWSSGSDSANVATPAGRSFSALIASLGGPPGKVEG